MESSSPRAGTPPEIHVLADDEGDSWHFTVRDSGIGIAEDDTASIFEIFRRLHGRDIPGSGIGLALTRKIVKAWGGESGLNLSWVWARPSTSPFQNRATSAPPQGVFSAALRVPSSQAWDRPVAITLCGPTC